MCNNLTITAQKCISALSFLQLAEKKYVNMNHLHWETAKNLFALQIVITFYLLEIHFKVLEIC